MLYKKSSSGGRSTPFSQDAKRAREQEFGGEFPYCTITEDDVFDDDEWPSPNRDGPVIPRYSPSGRQLGWVLE